LVTHLDKIKGAQELGAAGVLIYSDPRDDGYVTEDNGYLPYPHGPARNPTSVQRGSVQYLSLYPGDPTTPGYPAYEDAKREEGVNIPKIPSLPISWANAKVLLNELKKENEDPRQLNGRVSKRQVKIVNNGTLLVESDHIGVLDYS
jgi:N-acetylated-alpha-linked acidic dipeptidase